MSTNKLQDVKNAEGFVDHTIARLRKSFRITAIGAIALLVIETGYFIFLVYAIGTGLEAYSLVHVEQYRPKIDKYLFDPAKKILPELKDHTNNIPKSLEIILHGLPEEAVVGKYSNQVETVAVYFGKANDWVANKENYTNQVAKAKKILVDFNEKTKKINDEDLAKAKQTLRVFNEKTKEVSDESYAKAKQVLRVFNEEAKNSPEKFEQLKEMIGRINEPEDIEGMANLISQKIVGEMDSQGYMLTTTTKDYLRQNIDELPEWVKKQIPKYGARLRHESNNWIDFYCQSASDELGQTFDTFLEDNADNIREFSERTDDNETLDKLDEALTEEIVNFMKNTDIEDYGTLKEQSDKFLKRLKAANKLLRPLATKKTKDLTPQQLRLRSAIALFVSQTKRVN
jgi:hypothetical protein|tara:strand:+ start:71 stop:1267 length:1197 start_codon:yes stop_codon:yes gene_type:complete